MSNLNIYNLQLAYDVRAGTERLACVVCAALDTIRSVVIVLPF